ncbi:MAG: glycosyltransferase family 9 protein [Bdellovibrio sp.]|jgi:heptosyltransferase-3
MKILILQLARLGDIYLSWPAIRALKKQHPTAKITLLTREKFVQAATGLDAIDDIVTLPLKAVLAPLVQDNMDPGLSHATLKKFIQELRLRGFDQVINLSFSPVSSYIAHLVQADPSKVVGYSRTDDGFLSIPDDMSAYFYAQVGPGRANRFHLAEIFGTLCSADLTDADWAAPEIAKFDTKIQGPFVACHVGASEGHKTLSPEKWISIISHFKTLPAKTTAVALIGAEGERTIAETILSSVSGIEIHDFVGRTSVTETFSIVAQAALLVGPDSAPMHMASLSGTKCFNISVGRVNFWETGPRSKGSVVLRAANETDVASDRVARTMKAMLEGQKIEIGLSQVQAGTPSYVGLFPKEAEFHWKLVQAVYQGDPFPEPVSANFWEAHKQLFEVNQFLIDQMTHLQNGATIEEKAELINRGEEVLAAIGKLVPSWGPVIRWYQTEKIRIPPGDTTKVLARTIEIQNLFHQVLLVYADMQEVLVNANASKVESEGP